MKKPDGGPAYPGTMIRQMMEKEKKIYIPGMSIRDHACIELRIPDTNHEWLNELIKKAKRDELAAKAMQAILSKLPVVDMEGKLGIVVDDKIKHNKDISESTYPIADSMLQAGEKG